MTTLLVGPDAAHAADSADFWCRLSPQNPKAAPGTSVSVTATCGNDGPNTSISPLLVYSYPAGTTLGPLPQGWGPESSSSVGGFNSDLASGDTVQFAFTIMVPASATVGASLAQEIVGIPQTPDPNPGNDSASGRLVVAKAPAPTSAAPSRPGASPTHRPAKTRPSAATSAPTTPATAKPATSPGRSATGTAPSTPGADPTALVAALPLPSEAAGLPTAGSDTSGQGSGRSLLALALLAAGAVLIVGGTVTVLLLRRRRSKPGQGPGEAVPDRPATAVWQP